MPERSPSPRLTARQSLVLRGVVEGYVARAEPIGSQALVESWRLPVSAATVRNTMAELERFGLIAHPHHSAGRVPTARGYRLYVGALGTARPLPPGLRAAIDRGLAGAAGRRDLLRRASAVLARLSHGLALVWGPQLPPAPGGNGREADRELFFAGARELLRQPEFRDGARARQVVRLLDERPRRALFRLACHDGLRVWMDGAGMPGLRGLALVSTAVGCRRIEAALGVLGPLRMPYWRVMPLVASVRGRVEARAAAAESASERGEGLVR